MNGIIIFFIVLAAAATAAVLIRGLVIMASGKDITGQQSNRMMSYRVGLQAVTVILVVLLFLVMRGGD